MRENPRRNNRRERLCAKRGLPPTRPEQSALEESKKTSAPLPQLKKPSRIEPREKAADNSQSAGHYIASDSTYAQICTRPAEEAGAG
jgi:hypothetical protein